MLLTVWKAKLRRRLQSISGEDEVCSCRLVVLVSPLQSVDLTNLTSMELCSAREAFLRAFDTASALNAIEEEQGEEE
jgi:hypothetical protein